MIAAAAAAAAKTAAAARTTTTTASKSYLLSSLTETPHTKQLVRFDQIESLQHQFSQFSLIIRKVCTHERTH